MRRTAFDLFHPFIAFAYFVFLLVMDMAAMQPIYLLISFCAALVYNVILRGIRSVLHTLIWLVPFIALIALVNFALSAVGTTEIARIGSHAFYLESLVYGTSMGLMLASVILTFSNAAQVLTSDKIMALLGNVIPTISLMTCMVARLVPQFVRQGESIGSLRRACTAAEGVQSFQGSAVQTEHDAYNTQTARRERKAQTKQRARRNSSLRIWAREISVLMGWSMENSIDTADSMRARGWGSHKHRTTYMRYHFRLSDGVALAFLAVLMTSCAIAAFTACSQFEFYPQMGVFAPWWSYIAYMLFAVLPLVAEGLEWLRWRR